MLMGQTVSLSKLRYRQSLYAAITHWLQRLRSCTLYFQWGVVWPDRRGSRGHPLLWSWLSWTNGACFSLADTKILIIHRGWPRRTEELQNWIRLCCFPYVFTFMYLLELSDRITMSLANWRFGTAVLDISSPEISRRVEWQTIALKEGGYEESTWNEAGTTGPAGHLEHGDSLLGSKNLRSVWTSRTSSQGQHCLTALVNTIRWYLLLLLLLLLFAETCYAHKGQTTVSTVTMLCAGRAGVRHPAQSNFSLIQMSRLPAGSTQTPIWSIRACSSARDKTAGELMWQFTITLWWG